MNLVYVLGLPLFFFVGAVSLIGYRYLHHSAGDRVRRRDQQIQYYIQYLTEQEETE